MKSPNYRKKITVWLRFAGWFCLFPAFFWLKFYQVSVDMSFTPMILGELILTILFAVFVLTTATSDLWIKPGNIMVLLILSLFFIPLIVTLFLLFAYNASRKLTQQ